MTEQVPDAETVKAFNAGIIEEFRTNDGKLSGQFATSNLLLLSTVGAKSGRQRVNPLAYLRIDGKLLIVGSFRGADFHPAWVHNLRANPRAHIELGRESFDVTAREIPPAEREEVIAKVVAAAPVFGEYQAKTERVLPLFELQRA